MRRTRIKFCGVCRPEDAQSAVELGVDAISMVFHPPARRNVSIPEAQAILRVIPEFVTPIGLFVNRQRDDILAIAGEVGLLHFQLHGEETPEDIAELGPFSILKAIRVSSNSLATELKLWREAISLGGLDHLRGLILEPAASIGGSGIENDWEAIAQATHNGLFDGLPPVILAGGLTPDNVGGVVSELRPYAVDVSSGIEGETRCKSRDKMTRFIDAVRRADG